MDGRYGLRDDQWERIEGLLPGREGAVGVTAKDNRLFVEAVLTGIGRVFRGETFRGILVRGRRSAQDFHVGRPAVFGKVFSRP